MLCAFHKASSFIISLMAFYHLRRTNFTPQEVHLAYLAAFI